MILSIVLALIIFYYGIPLALWLICILIQGDKYKEKSHE